ncbi:uncharacterized protein LOC134745805 [Cydia strobilella]|uniref:uncharacterized protein LOC134745805 n=1 Tax=Cydia strobilella TaxID=1100964 RepID=UPI003005A870
MESVLTPPLPFKFEENVTNMAFGSLCESWEKWKNGFQIYVKACELNKKTEEIQMNIFLHVVGEQCREIIEQSKTKSTTLAALIGQVDNHFKAKKNVTVERHRFFTRQQGEHESIDQYVFELRKLAQSCEFGDLNDGLIKDRLVCGIVSAAIRERLLREDDLTLNKALEICRAAIVSKMYSEDIKRECTSELKGSEVCAVANKEVFELNRSGAKVEAKSSRSMSSGRGWRGRGWVPGAGRAGASGAAGPAGAQHRAPYAHRGGRCGQCGGVHKKYDCPAYGRSCMKCSRPNHFARMCRVYMVEESEDQPGKHLYIADTLSRAYEPSASVEHAGREALHDEVCAVERALAVVADRHFTDHQFVALQKQTDTDDELVQLRKCILKGWPDDRKDLVDVLRPYWTYRDELTVAQGIVRAPDRWGNWI